MKVKIVGDVFSSCGISQFMREIIYAMKDVWEISIGQRKLYTDHESDFDQHDEILAMIDKFEEADVAIHVMNPEHYQKDVKSKKNIGYFFYEAIPLPFSLSARIDDIDGTIVANNTTLEAFRTVNNNRKILVVPGYYHQSLSGTQYTDFLPDDVMEKQTYLYVGAFQHRKAWDAVLRAWWYAFDNQDDVCLVMKVYGDYTDRSIDIMKQEFLRFEFVNSVRDRNGSPMHNGAPIYLIFDKLSNWEMDFLYKSCDVLVAPSRGESWGRPIMEGVMHDMPVLLSEFMLQDVPGKIPSLTKEGLYPFYPVEGMFVPCMNMQFNVHADETGRARPNFPITSVWFEPSPLSIVRGMETFQNWEKRDGLYQSVKEQLTKDVFATNLSGAVNDICS